ncbi:MAG: RNA polymerase factor sigma-54 [Burkholderiaceae bacterium]|nr:MAG: RNA polymerase factor sigma-54 [Burkholderiaceae bacterium]
MKPSLQLRLSQSLSLTPQLQQSIRLLQLSTLELHQELEQMLADNPLLERLDDPLADSVRLLADGSMPASNASLLSDAALTTPGNADAAGDTDNSEAGMDGSDGGSGPDTPDGNAELSDWGSGGGSGNARSEDDESSLQQIAATPLTLRDHLLRQLSGTQCGDRDRALVGLMIDSLDENGFLEHDLDTLLENLPPELEIDLTELSASLKLLQSFEPTGVGARSLSECLSLQLQALKLKGVASRTRTLALSLVQGHLTALAERDYVRLKKALDCEDEDLRAAQDLIRTLNPRPGSAFAQVEHNYVIPDVVVRKIRGQWQAVLNSDVMPRLRVNADYAGTLRSLRTRARNKSAGVAAPTDANGEAIATGTPMQAQLQEARWYIKNVQQRFETILRVAQAIVERQKNFFSHGAVGMRPLVLREIADTLGLHESTISRVTTQKYMLTPFGTFELKYFFGSHVATDSGGAASSTAIRALIKQLIGEENPQKPLSDSQIADLLGEQGFVVARRTVAKYREALKIAPVNLRKAL